MKKIKYGGTTIVELVLYMGLLSVFIVILFNLFAQILNTQTRSTAVSLVQTNGNFLLTKLTHDINQADSIVTPSGIGTSSVSMVLKIGTTNATYTVTNGRLQLMDTSGTFNLNDVDTSISDFVSHRLGNPGGKSGLQISFTIRSNVEDGANIKTRSFSTFATLR